MIELRWVWHDLSKGGPPTGSMPVGNGQTDPIYQKLQYRTRVFIAEGNGWSDWQDVPHSGEMA